MIDKYDEYRNKMISSETYREEKSQPTKKIDDSFFYKISGRDFIICDITCCGESERTFDINFFDFAKNLELQRVLNICIIDNIEDCAKCLASFGHMNETKKFNKLMTNTTLRILVENENLFIEVLSILSPDDIRVRTHIYNL